MSSQVLFMLSFFASHVVFLIMCMHLAGKVLGIDFGSFWPAVGKASVVLLAVSVVQTFFGNYLPCFARLLVTFTVYYFGFIIAFGLDTKEAWMFTMAYFIMSWLLFWVLLMILIGTRMA